MTSPPDDTTTDTSAIIAALRTERDAALAREAALAEALATRNSEFGERIEHQAATIDVLKAMSASPGDPQPVFDLIVERARDLCDAYGVTVLEFDGGLLHYRAANGVSDDAETREAFVAMYPRPPARDMPQGRAILDRRTIRIDDLEADQGLNPFYRGITAKSTVVVPLMRGEVAIGTVGIGGRERGGFSDSQIELLKTFAEQAVIAITSAETYRALQIRTADLQETLEYRTAISDVLKVISRSTFDLQPVLDTVAETAARLCDAEQAAIFRREGDLVRLVANWGFPPEYEAFCREAGAFPFDRSPQNVGPRAIREARPVHIHDVTAVPGYAESAIRLGKQRTSLGVPLLREGEVIGIIVLARQRVEPFTDRQIELVSTFADQAVIAIENTRLITEQREALEQQTATAEVLQVINGSPGDLAPVFDATLEKALRLCESSFGGLHTYNGECISTPATRGMPQRLVEFLRHPIRPAPGMGFYRIIQGEEVVHTADLTDDAVYRSGNPARVALADLGGARTQLLVALRKDNTLLGMINVFRQEVRPFSDRQIALLQNFAAQAVIAMENARLLDELRQRTADLQESLEYQTATSDVLKAISQSKFDLQPVLEALVATAARLCGAEMVAIARREGEGFRLMASLGLPAEFEADRRLQGVIRFTMRSVSGRAVRERRAVHVPDASAEPDYPEVSVKVGRQRTSLGVPLLREGEVIGAMMLARQRVEPFTDRQIELVTTFADQAVIAIENTRLITDQKEALEQQTATAEVLQVINAKPGDLAPVFDAMLEKAMRLCEAAFGFLAIYDGELFRPTALRGVPDALASYFDTGMDQPRPGEAHWRLLAGEELVHNLDQMDEDAYRSGSPLRRAIVDLGGARSALVVALRKDDVLLGALTIYRKEVRPFSEKQIALLQNFAAQAVIAMENARLINEQREALEQQTAISEIFQVINASPGELTPVFSAMLDKALRLCEAASGGFFTYDGEHFRTEATQGVPPALAAFRAKNPPTARRLLERRGPVHNVDLRTDPDYLAGDASRRAVVELGGARTMLNVPLLKDRTVLGFIAIYRQEVRAFSDKQIALVENFAAQAVIAMENARLLQELRARTNELAQRQEELRVTFENMGDGVAMFDETPRLVAWNRKFQDILDLPDGVLAESLTFAEYVRYLAERGEYGEADPEEQIRRLTENADQYRAFERLRPDGRVIEIRHNPVPSGGFVLIYSDITERKRSEEEIRAARDAAETALRELRTAQANLIQAEKMASLGQLTAGIAHEIKNPLNFVNNFAALSVDLLSELKETAAPGFAALTEKQRAEVEEVSVMLTSNLEKITEHGKRADGIVKAMLEHSRGSSGERRVVDLNALIDEALNLAYHGARAQDQSFNVTLERDFGAGIATIEVNPQDITRVFLNIFSNGFYATTKRARDGGGAAFVPMLKVITRNADEAVEIRVRDNGIGIPVDIRDKLFQPFFTTKPTGEGTGLGLSITYDIVTQQHGGNIAVDSEVGEYSEFTIQLPRKP